MLMELTHCSWCTESTNGSITGVTQTPMEKHAIDRAPHNIWVNIQRIEAMLFLQKIPLKVSNEEAFKSCPTKPKDIALRYG